MEELKDLRLEIDGLFQLTDSLVKTSKVNDNIHLEKVKECCDKLLYAKAWTVKLMGFLGGTSPYQNEGKRKEVKDIEPTDAIAGVDNTFGENGEDSYKFDQLGYIEKVDWLRQTIEQTNNKVVNFVVPQGSSREANISRTQIFVYLTEARLALGFELERLRGGR